LEVLLR
jgi:hypothetical protein